MLYQSAYCHLTDPVHLTRMGAVLTLIIRQVAGSDARLVPASALLLALRDPDVPSDFL